MPQQKPSPFDPDAWVEQKRSQLDPDAWMQARTTQDQQTKQDPAALLKQLSQDSAFASLPPERRTQMVYERLQGQPFPQEEPMVSRIAGAGSKWVTETAGGLAGLPGALIGLFTEPRRPSPWLLADPTKGTGIIGTRLPEEPLTPETVPIVGPLGKEYGETFGRDPVEASVKAALDILTLAGGTGTKAAGTKLAETTAAAERAALARGIPGAPVTALEARTGVLPGAGRAVAASPLGEQRVADLAAQRQPAIEAAIEKLVPAGQQLTEEQALAQQQALRRGHLAESRALKERVAQEDVARKTAEQQTEAALKEQQIKESEALTRRYSEEDLRRAQAEAQAKALAESQQAAETTGLEREISAEAAQRASETGAILPSRAEALAPGVTRETVGPQVRGAMTQRLARGPEVQPQGTRLLTEGAAPTEAVTRIVSELPAVPMEAGRVQPSRIPNIGATEQVYWNAVDDAARQLGGTSNVPNATRAAASELPLAVESWKRIATTLSEKTRAVLARLSPNAEAALGTSAVTPAEREGLRRLMAESPLAEPITWDALKEGRTEIGNLLDRARREDILGSNETRVLKKIYRALSRDMREMISGSPELTQAFDISNDLTKYKRDIYGKGPVEKMLRESRTPGAIEQSEIISKIPGMTAEEVTAVVEALGPNPEVQAALRSSLLRDVAEKATTKSGAFDAQAAIDLLTGKPGYRAALGGAEVDSLVSQLSESTARGRLAATEAEGLKAAVKGERARTGLEETGRKAEEAAQLKAQRQAERSQMAQRYRTKAQAEAERKAQEAAKLQTQRAAERGQLAEKIRTEREAARLTKAKAQGEQQLRDLFHKSTKGKLGEPGAIFDGPGFASRWRNARSRFEKMGLDREHLKAIDEFADEVGKLGLSKQAALRKGAASPGYGSYLTLTALLGTVAGLAIGSVKPLVGAGAMAAGERALMHYLMQPEGPHLLARALKLQKLGKPLGEVGDALAKMAVAMPKEEKREPQTR